MQRTLFLFAMASCGALTASLPGVAFAAPPASGASAAAKALTLDDAVRLAKRKNLTVRSARLAVSSAREGQRGAWALLGPRISASLGLSFMGGENAFGAATGSTTLDSGAVCSDPATATACQQWMAANGAYTSALIGQSMSGMSSLGAIQNADTASASLNLSWSLFSYQNVVTIQQAKVVRKSSKATLTNTTQDVVANVTVGFYNVLAAEEGITISAENASNSRKHLRQAETLLRVGNGTKLDVLRWRSQVANDRQSSVEATQQLANARVTLNRLLGRPLRAPLRLQAPAAARKESPPRPAADVSLSRAHPQLRLSRLTVESKDLSRKSAVAAFLPSVNLSAGYSWSRFLPYEKSTEGIGTMGSWNVGVTLTIPLFDSTQRVFALRQAEAEQRKARVDAEHTKRLLSEQLLMANQQVMATWEKLKASREELTTAKAAHASATNLYRAGNAKTTDVLDAQKTLVSASFNNRNARYGYLMALAQRDRAAGRIR